MLVEMERKIQRRPVKLVVATQIETLVESMFEEEEECGYFKKEFEEVL